MAKENFYRGVCPVCGGEIKFTGEDDGDGSYVGFGWYCPECGTEGIEWCTIEFDFNDVTIVGEKEKET